jgi:serine/threonine-protein kinase
MAADDDLILDLLERWEDARIAGDDLTVEELCRDRPDLVGVVREKIAALSASDWMRPEPLVGAMPRVLAGRYRLERLVGQGGYGQVWRAFDEELHRPVAVKVPQPSRRLGERQIDQLLTEARRVARLRHPGVVAVHDVQKEGAAYFLVSDLIEGEDLAELLRRGPLSVDAAVDIAVQVARVLDYAHGQGVVHRDIKPSNVLLGADGSVHVCDFGIAATQAELVNGHDRRATLAYASPEQLGDGSVDHRTDLWSLGVLLFEMLTGQRPFDSDDPVRLQQQILAAEPPALPGVPDRLAAVCRRCLAKKPEERFSSGADVTSALEAVNASRPRRWPVLLGIVGFAAVVGLGVWLGLRTPTTTQPVVDVQKEAGVDLPNDRAEAEWVLSRGGRVRLRLPDGRADLVVATPESLPAGSWGLDGVILEGAKLDEAMIARIAQMRTLRTLHLGGSNVTTAHLIVLKQGLRLRMLGVNWIGLTDDQLGVVADFAGLEELDMSGAKITAGGVRHLRRATSLRDIALNSVSLSQEVVTEFGQLKQLRKIYLGIDEVVARRELQRLLPECQLLPPSKPPILPARVLEGHTTPIRAVQFRADGSWIASADEKTLRLWPPAG